ncbi:902_t:CDS:2 [Paraglomus occultum]|uniref:902_t:CDS:1 n=1 Tax=Paraglomus occultum TaxID=144539 RepID=A0A9N8Z7E6_9GLOM|nr:902_t:CDS:2 [Paraglomus occultum]
MLTFGNPKKRLAANIQGRPIGHYLNGKDIIIIVVIVNQSRNTSAVEALAKNQWKGFYKHLVDELYNNKLVDDHSNILRFAGISKDICNDYRMSLESGNLHDYLKDFYQEMTLETKTVLGLSIANGLNYLHDMQIIHKYLALLKYLVSDSFVKLKKS